MFKRLNCTFRRKKQPIQRKRATIAENELHICIRKRDETFKHPEKTKQYPTEKTKQYPLEKTKQYPIEKQTISNRKNQQYPTEKTKHSRKGTKENKRSIPKNE